MSRFFLPFSLKNSFGVAKGLSRLDSCIKCTRCNREFESVEDLRTHLNTHPMHWRCEVLSPFLKSPCTFDADNFLDLRAHWDVSKHQMYCDHCMKGWLSPLGLQQHLREHVCKYCDEHFVSTDILDKHVDLHFFETSRQLSPATGRQAEVKSETSPASKTAVASKASVSSIKSVSRKAFPPTSSPSAEDARPAPSILLPSVASATASRPVIPTLFAPAALSLPPVPTPVTRSTLTSTPALSPAKTPAAIPSSATNIFRKPTPVEPANQPHPTPQPNPMATQPPAQRPAPSSAKPRPRPETPLRSAQSSSKANPTSTLQRHLTSAELINPSLIRVINAAERALDLQAQTKAWLVDVCADRGRSRQNGQSSQNREQVGAESAAE